MKRYAVVFTPRAEHQLAELYAYIADQGGEPRAASYIGKIIAACDALATFPARGTQRDDFRPDLRIMGYAKSVTIAFSVDATTEAVAVHGVFYGGQDFETLLRDAQADG
ncbi:MAG: type II toxin-antitoxin system RelE/ParE family toxin [Alphaproteobacteria bacterium]|nr:type II toxin-antitoxin system RelE/ParE family toxin [Alphaproteobacteria bacterium]